MKKKLLHLGITLLAGLIYFYIALPAINLTNPAFYVFLAFLIIVYELLEAGSAVIEFNRHSLPKIKWSGILLIPIMVILILVINFFASPVFNSKSYSNRIVIDETGDFAAEIEEVDFTHVPLLDKDSSEKLGDRMMGEMSDLVSQYYVSDMYTQINYNNKIVRATPLEYASIIKYFSNRKDGVKGYITVDSTSGESKVTRLDKGMHYVPSAVLNEDMIRHLRFRYLTKIFGDYSFEIDEEGNPYFIVPTIKYTAVGLKADIDGVIVLDPISGDTEYYKVGDVPAWIDNVYKANLIIEQTDDWGTYKGGFFNSLFAQKNVTNTTDGYNYLAMNDDIYLYTGITSVQNDESNLGFILSNMRTKETVFYSAPGAEEYSAMASAEGQVQEMKYVSTFPLLINLNNRPTYLVSLKDNAGLVKKYAFIDVQDYQKVYVSDVQDGIEKASEGYLEAFNLESNVQPLEKDITIDAITTAIIEGNTVYYIIDTDKNKYSANINVAKNTLPFLKTGDKIKIKYLEGSVNTIKSIED